MYEEKCETVYEGAAMNVFISTNSIIILPQTNVIPRMKIPARLSTNLSLKKNAIPTKRKNARQGKSCTVKILNHDKLI